MQKLAPSPLPFPRLYIETTWREQVKSFTIFWSVQSRDYVKLFAIFFKSSKIFGSCLLWVMSPEISVDIAVDIAVDSRSIVGRQSVDSLLTVGRQSVDSRLTVGR